MSDLYSTYHAIFDHAPNCIKILTKEGHLLKMNRAGLDLIDADSIDQVYMHKVEQLVHPEDLEIFRGAHNLAISGKKVEATFRIITLKGTTRYMHSVLSPMRSKANGEIDEVLSITRDITQEHINRNLFDEIDQQFTSLFNHHPDAIINTDIHGFIRRVNPAACDLLEGVEFDLVNKHYQNFLTVEYEKGEAYFNKGIAGEAQQYEIFINTSKGNEKLVAVTLIPYKVANVTVGVTAVVKDITEIKTAEEEVKLKSYLLDKIQQSVILCDKSGAVTYWNEYSTQLFGWIKDEVYARNVLEILPIADNHEHALSIFSDLLSGKNWDGNFVLSRKDKTTFTARISASPFYSNDGNHIIGVIGLVSDITLELKNREAADFQAYLLDSVQQSIIAVDNDGKVTYWNKYATHLYGYEADEARGNSMDELGLIGSNKAKNNNNIIHDLSIGKSWSGEYKMRSRKGDDLHLYAIISPLYQDGIQSGLLTIAFDISEQKKIELERDQLIAELTQRNQDLKEYGYTVSHSMRAPIANLTGLLSLVNKAKIADIETLEIIDGIEVSTQRLANVLNDLIETLSVKEGANIKKTKISFANTLKEVQASMLALTTEQAVKFNVNFNDAPEVNYHQPYLSSLFYNLISNSVRFKHPDKNPQIDITTNRVGNKTVLIYRDNGLGFDVKKLENKLFGLHQRFHQHKEGRGLGLYLIKTQLRMMGGKIELESKPNEGSTFIITF